MDRERSLVNRLDSGVPDGLDSLSATPPYRPSWVDHVLRWVQQLPMPNWMFYLVLFAVGYVGVTALRLHDGASINQSLAAPPPPFLIWDVYLLALTQFLNHVARHRLAAFRPALDLDDRAYAEIEYRLTTIPARGALLSGLVWVVIAGVILWLARDVMARLHYASWEVSLTLVSYLLGGAVIYHTAHQLREVSRLHRQVTRVDLYQLDPLHAFSGLTAVTALGWIFLLYITAAIVPKEMVNSGLGATWIAVMALAAAAFVVPLLGMHQRLEAAQQEAIAEANRRLKQVVAQVNERIDRGELEGLDAFNKATTALLAEREILAKVSTWPWATTTARGFFTALLLPIVLRLAQEGLERMLHF